jgi:hypothetical protein
MPDVKTALNNLNQIGFSKKSRTSDHIFVLKCILEKYLKTDTKKLFVCFVDFHKAFDTVIHSGIRYKVCAVFNNSFPIISNPGLFPFFKLQIALLSSEADMRKSRQENDLNSGFCSNSFTFLFSSSIFL